MDSTYVPNSFPSSSPPKIARRHFLGGGALLGTTAFWLYHANSPIGAALALETQKNYIPQYFTPNEYQILDCISEHIFPTDEHGPGGRALHVAQFIDRQMDTPYAYGKLWYMEAPFLSGPPELGYQLPYAPRELYRKALASLEIYCQNNHQKNFIQLSSTQQEDILHLLEANKIQLDDIAGNIFFDQIRTNILEGVFSDPLYGGNHLMEGWKMLGFPGARADFMDFINQDGKQYPYGPVSIPTQPLPPSHPSQIK